MVNIRLEITYKISKHDLEVLYRKEKDSRVKERLLMIVHAKEGKTTREIGKIVRRSYVCVANWINRFNKEGVEGLRDRERPGKPPKLTKKQKKELKKILKTKENRLTSEVMGLIKEKFGVSYSLRQVSRILRSFGMHYSKPYPEDYRKPKNAKKILKDRLTDALKNKKGQCVIGFVDEARPQTTDNKQRYWSFNKSKIVKNTTKLKANTFGFYPVNGKSIMDFKENSRKESVCEFLRKVREKNPTGTIIVILDNFKSHIAEATKQYTKSLGIILVFLPPYSPKLNPIEQIWRCIRRKISQIFVKSEYSFLETIRSEFYRLAKKSSFMKNWLEECWTNFV